MKSISQTYLDTRKSTIVPAPRMLTSARWALRERSCLVMIGLAVFLCGCGDGTTHEENAKSIPGAASSTPDSSKPQRLTLTQLKLLEEQGNYPENFIVDKLPVPVHTEVPDYPEAARDAGQEGMVWMKILVGKDGSVVRVELIKTDAKVFAGPAVECAKKWKFTPAVLEGEPVACWAVVPLRFKLSR